MPLDTSPQKQNNGNYLIYVMTTIKNAQNTSENTEDTLECKKTKLQKYVVLCLLLTMSTHKTKSFVTAKFSTQEFKKIKIMKTRTENNIILCSRECMVCF